MWYVLVLLAFVVGCVFCEIQGRKFMANAKQLEADLKQFEETVLSKGAADKTEALAFISRLRSVL